MQYVRAFTKHVMSVLLRYVFSSLHFFWISRPFLSFPFFVIVSFFCFEWKRNIVTNGQMKMCCPKSGNILIYVAQSWHWTPLSIFQAWWNPKYFWTSQFFFWLPKQTFGRPTKMLVVQKKNRRPILYLDILIYVAQPWHLTPFCIFQVWWNATMLEGLCFGHWP